MIISVPTYKNELAPSFDFCSSYYLYTIEDKIIKNKDKYVFLETSPHIRAHQLKNQNTNIVICNGIHVHTERILRSYQIQVIWGIHGEVEMVVQRFIDDEIQPQNIDLNQVALQKKTKAENIIEWSKNFFLNQGFQVVSLESKSTNFSIDFIGEKICPVCHKRIKVAVCCGIHLYRTDAELREFVHQAGEQFDAKIYVHPSFPGVSQLCDHYRVLFLDSCKENKNDQKRIMDKLISHRTLTA